MYELYIRYTANRQHLEQRVKDWGGSDCNWVRHIDKQMANRLNLTDYLHKPIQHYTRYGMLLQSVSRQVDKSRQILIDQQEKLGEFVFLIFFHCC